MPGSKNQSGKKNDREPQFWRPPLDLEKYSIPKGKIHIISDRCKGCMFCIEFCPNRVLESSQEFNAKGYHPPYVANENDCVACKLCELICPEFAIYVEDELVENLKDKKQESRNTQKEEENE